MILGKEEGAGLAIVVVGKEFLQSLVVDIESLFFFVERKCYPAGDFAGALPIRDSGGHQFSALFVISMEPFAIL